jgi:uncharacterized protein YdhG (YjbR/CyaY superfamily)
MQSKATTPDQYIAELPDDRREVITKLRDSLNKKLPKGFKEGIGYGMLCYSVPHSLYPQGYHVDPKMPLGFISIASQKNHIAIYHMALYSGALLDWFLAEWPKYSSKKLDMGKACIRFKKPEDIPFDLFAELFSKMSPQQWIEAYESALKSAGTQTRQTKK